MKVTFKIPAMRIPRELTRMSREEEALLSVLEDTLLARRETVVNLARKAFDVRFICTGEQFAKFIIARTQRGVANWVKELEPEVVGGTYKPVGGNAWVVDSSAGGKPTIRRDRPGLYPHQQDTFDTLTAIWAQGHEKYRFGDWTTYGVRTGRIKAEDYARGYNMGPEKWKHTVVTMDYADIEKRVLANVAGKQWTVDAMTKPRIWLAEHGMHKDIYAYCAADVFATDKLAAVQKAIKETREGLLTELADAMHARADKQQLKVNDAPDFVRRSGGAMNALRASVKRYTRLAANFRAMRDGGKSFAQVDAEEVVESNREAAKRHPGNKFSLVVGHVRKVLYYINAEPRNVIKVDGENTFYHENDEALDWSTFRAKWSF